MRILLSQKSKDKLFGYLRIKNDCASLKELAEKMGINFGTLQNWLYKKDKYLPDKIIPEEIKQELERLDEKEDNWGKVEGGRKTYKILIDKYGLGEIRRRQSLGGKASIKNLTGKKQIPFVLDINNQKFLEFYGVLLGDGWLSHLRYKNKDIWLVGVSGDKRLDKELFYHLQGNIRELFDRTAGIRERKEENGMQMDFTHKMLIKALNEELGFPIGMKVDLEINRKIYSLGYEKMRHVIRGIFDTDGSFYFDKAPNGKPYPCICITMKAPRLIKQVYDMLIRQGFKARHDKHRQPIEQIVLKGRIQLKKWMSEIGSNNQRHLRKIALVAQPG